jgi:Cellulose-binding Sde182, nucleoside hydrolase-like domain/Cellulose-binding protein Sde0182, C-terminal domain
MTRATILQTAFVSILFATPLAAASLADSPGAVDDFTGKPRLFVLTDIGNEPDDQMSLVRLLLYSNEIDIEGLVATTSTWQRDKVQPQMLLDVIHAYGEVQPNLLKHSRDYPAAASLESRVAAGPPAYGLAGIQTGLSSGAAALLAAAGRQDARPLWITVWGGANTLAEALRTLRATRPAELETIIRRLRVYSVSDQDDAGPWIRREFPQLFYIVKPSTPDSGEYGTATWTGISGDVFYANCEGADPSLVTNQWLDEHIRGRSALGRHYPRFAFIMEGDTPSFLGLLANGLESYRSPSWGGWGGRYLYRQPYGESRAIWTQGGDVYPRVTSRDAVIGIDGKLHTSDQATVWRWRAAYQNDFAARMDWTVKDFAAANHAPAVVVNGVAGKTPLLVDAQVGLPLRFDAAGSQDPDGHALRYHWFHYPEAGFVPDGAVADVTVTGSEQPKITVTPTAACRPDWQQSNKSCHAGVAHLILAVTDDGTPALTSYRRVILNVKDAR